MEQTTNEAVVQKNPGGARLKKSGRWPLVALGVIVGVLVLAYVDLCAYAASLDTFYPNRRINGIEVGGMTAAEAQKKLEADLLAQEITLTDGESAVSAAITVADLGYSAEDFAGDAQFWMEEQTRRLFLGKGWDFLCDVT